jgi:catechol 2,3-dioxygenase-like lactoylglutathione lyase family enzyme
VSLEVENLAALVARMKGAGVTVEREPAPLGNGRQAALVRSPDGLLIELVDSDAPALSRPGARADRPPAG